MTHCKSLLIRVSSHLHPFVCRYARHFFISGPTGLVVGVSRSGEGNVRAACMVNRNSEDPFQLWKFRNHQLINKAGFRLEVATDGLAGAQVCMCLSSSISQHSSQRWAGNGSTEFHANKPEVLWKFEQGRLLSFKTVQTSSNKTQKGTPYALHVLSEGLSGNVIDGALLIVSPAPTRKNVRVQNFKPMYDPPGSGAIIGEVTSDGSTRVLTFYDSAECM